jgi:hypothetical protein
MDRGSYRRKSLNNFEDAHTIVSKSPLKKSFIDKVRIKIKKTEKIINNIY